MKLLLNSPLLLFLLVVLLLSGCTASERAAKQARKEQFYAERQARKNGGKREVVPHRVGEDPKLAHLADKADKKRKRKEKKQKNATAASRSRGSQPHEPISSNAPRLYTSKDVATVIRTARSYIGTPYRDAGTTRIGMDCSGLIVTSFQSIDLKLPRNSRDQSNFGSPVRLEELREGDLVFFGPSRGSSQITHVGMVTDVKGRQEVTFIHSSSSLGVIENNLYSKYYYERFVKACRPF